MMAGARTRRFGVFALLVFVNTLVLTYFYDRSWWPPDEGHYAHVAERLLQGEVIHADVREFHTEYIHVVHVLALKLFGKDLVSFRFPLMAITLLQSCLLFAIFASASLWMAVIAALALTSLSSIQFLNPTPNWYGLCLAVSTAWCLSCIPRQRRIRLPLIGLLVALTGLFRQLTGLFLGMGVLAFLLAEIREGARGHQVLLARSAIAAMAIGLILYLISTTDLLGLALFGVWPLALLWWCLVTTSVSNRALGVMLARLTLGAIVPLAPILVYHVAHGSLEGWLSDTVLGALSVPKLWYLKMASYGDVLSAGFRHLTAGAGIAGSANAVYWLVLPLLGAANGFATLGYVRALKPGDALRGAVPFLAVFYGLVSVFNQIPVYLYYSVGFSLAGLLWLNAVGPRRRVVIWMVVATALSGIGMSFQAGQPIFRRMSELVTGQRVALMRNRRFEHARLWMTPNEIRVYGDLVELVQRETRTDEPIFVLPNNAEVYFLTGRRNRFEFYNTALALTSEPQVRDVIERLRREPPRLVIHHPEDKYNTPLTAPLVEMVQRNYDKIADVGPFKVYRRR